MQLIPACLVSRLAFVKMFPVPPYVHSLMRRQYVSEEAEEGREKNWNSGVLSPEATPDM